MDNFTEKIHFRLQKSFLCNFVHAKYLLYFLNKQGVHLGGRHSSVYPSAHTILPHQVQTPSTTSKLHFFQLKILIVKRMKINKKRSVLAHIFEQGGHHWDLTTKIKWPFVPLRSNAGLEPVTFNLLGRWHLLMGRPHPPSSRLTSIRFPNFYSASFDSYQLKPINRVTSKKSPNVYKSCPKMISLENEWFWHLYKNCLTMWSIWVK